MGRSSLVEVDECLPYAVMRDSQTAFGDPLPRIVEQFKSVRKANACAKAAATKYGRAWVEKWDSEPGSGGMKSKVLSGWKQEGEELVDDPLAGPTPEQLAD